MEKINKNDILTCKKTTKFFTKNKTYIVDNVLSYSTTHTTVPSWFWKKPNISDISDAYTIIINNQEILSTNIFNIFYTKKETRKLKLKKLNDI